MLASNYLGDTYEAVLAAGRAGFKIRELEAPIQNRINGQSVQPTIKVFTSALLQIHAYIGITKCTRFKNNLSQIWSILNFEGQLLIPVAFYQMRQQLFLSS